MDGHQPRGATESRQSNPPALGRRIYQKGLQTFVWKAEDGNDDRLQFDVAYRREGETAWRPLRAGLWDPIVVWDTTSVPDGTYVIRISATDAPSNAPGTALTGELESGSFDIDNTPPTIEVQPAARAAKLLTFAVADEQSPIQRVEYSLDASRWRLVHPKDGIPDSRREEFEIVAGGSRARPQRHPPRHRRDEQRRDAGSQTKLRIKNSELRTLNPEASKPSGA